MQLKRKQHNYLDVGPHYFPVKWIWNPENKVHVKYIENKLFQQYLKNRNSKMLHLTMDQCKTSSIIDYNFQVQILPTITPPPPQ